MRFRTAEVLAVLLAAVLSGACGGEVAFRTAGGIEVVAPIGTEDVAAPVVLQWAPVDDDLAASVAAGERFYAVFVDRSAILPGDSLASVIDDDCPSECATRELLAEENVYVTREPTLILTRLLDNRTSKRDGAQDRHTAVVVVVDGDGIRRSDEAATIRFTLRRVSP